MSELRKDPVTGRWVIIAAAREKRPRHFTDTHDSARTEPCPFCAGNESLTPPEVWSHRETDAQRDSPGWRVRVVPNKYPALQDGGTWRGYNDGIYESWNALGVHEVIIESPAHVVNMGTLDENQFVHVLQAYCDRMRELQNDRRWRYLLVYKNQGDRAGATLEHVHSQLVALPAVPREAIGELTGAKRHYESTGRCIYCSMIQRESQLGERLVSLSDSFIAFCPFAPRFPYEVWVLPKNHAAAFTECCGSDIVALASTLRAVIRRLNRALDNPPFNYFIHSMPVHETATSHYHWHLEILPQLARAAGFEWGSGAHMTSVAPEGAARLLRDVTL